MQVVVESLENLSAFGNVSVDQDDEDSNSDNGFGSDDDGVANDVGEVNDGSVGAGSSEETECIICSEIVQDEQKAAGCLDCSMKAHVVCLAEWFLKSTDSLGKKLIPESGFCPVCRKEMNWPAVVSRILSEGSHAKQPKRAKRNAAKHLNEESKRESESNENSPVNIKMENLTASPESPVLESQATNMDDSDSEFDLPLREYVRRKRMEKQNSS